jgi:dTDP-4-dehydrorhamnose 3,5-epimerase
VRALERSQPGAGVPSIEGTRVLRPTLNADERGSVLELCRAVWLEPVELVQWNVVTSVPGTIRGLHWHNRHHDFISPVHGRVLVALADLRAGSPTEHVTTLLDLSADEPAAVLVPPGVAHGLQSPGHSVVMYAVSRYWDPADEFGVRFDDPTIGIPWLDTPGAHVTSARDRDLPRLRDAGRPPSWVQLAAPPPPV